MTKKVKRLASLLIAGVMLLQLLPAGAQAFKQDRGVVNHFDTFAGYVSTADDTNFPTGWENGIDIEAGKTKSSKVDSETGTTAFSVGYLGRVVFPFDEVISSGKIKVSFDLKTVIGSVPGAVSFSSHVALTSDDVNVRDYNFLGSGTWGDRRMTYLLNKGASSDTDLAVYGTSNSDGTRLSNQDGAVHPYGSESRIGTKNEWHKYEILIDLEAATPTVTATMDGLQLYSLATMDLTRAIKDFHFRNSGNSANYIDNFYVNHYFDEADNAPMIAIDEEAEEGYANIVFSEAINDEVTVDDFTITSSDGTTVVKPLAATVLPNSTVKLTMPELAKGTYTIACVSTNVTKTGIAPANTVTYTEVGNIDIEADEQIAYADFDRYLGGVPTDWFGITETITSDDVSADNGALKINAGKTLAYAFKNNILMGGLSYIRFKVKAGTKWTMNLLDEAAVTEKYNTDGTRWIYQAAYNKLYEDFVANYDSTAEKEEWIFAEHGLTMEEFNALTEEEQELLLEGFTGEPDDAAWFEYINNLDEATLKAANDAEIMKSVLVGSDGTNIKANTTRSADLTNATVVDDVLDNDGDGWTSVSIDLAFDGSKFNVRVDGQTAVSIAYDKERFDRIMLVDTDSTIALREPIHGLGGIAFTADSSNAIVIDDVHVTNGDSYNLYNDFNNANGNKRIYDGYRFPGMYIHSKDGYGTYGPLTAKETDNRTTNVQYAGGGINSSACLLLGDATTTYPMIYLLTTPVKKYTPFVIEFDVHATNGWYIGFVNEKDSVFRGSNTTSGTVTSTGEEGKSNPTANSTRVFFLNDSNAFYGGTMHTGGYSFPFTSNGTAMTNTDSEFWHIKLEVKWDATNLDYRLSTNLSGSADAPVVSDWVQTTPGGSWERNDIVGLVLSSRGATKFDNLKVYEANTPKASGIQAFKAITANGTETTLSDSSSIESNTSAIKVDFTVPLESATGVSVKYSDGTAAPVGQLTLSSDKKSVIASFTSALEVGKKIVVDVSQDTPVSSKSYTQFIRTETRNYSIVEPSVPTEGIVTVNDFRLYQLVADTTGGGYSIPGGLYPARISSLSQKDLANYKAVIKGTNTGATAQLYTLIAGYDTTGEYMVQVVPVDATAQNGEFTATVDLSQLTELTTLGEGKIKAFLWDKDTYEPVADNLDYDWSAPLATE